MVIGAFSQPVHDSRLRVKKITATFQDFSMPVRVRKITTTFQDFAMPVRDGRVFREGGGVESILKCTIIRCKNVKLLNLESQYFEPIIFINVILAKNFKINK